MNTRDFENISSYGRIAYSILCLEKSLIFYKYSTEDWNWILEKIWSFSNARYFDEWFYEFINYVPSIILEDEYCNDDLEYITEQQFNVLRSLYTRIDEVIVKIFDYIKEMAGSDLYSKIRNEGLYTTLTYLEEIIKLMESQSIELPQYDDLLKYKFDLRVNGGYGENFIGREHSLILI